MKPTMWIFPKDFIKWNNLTQKSFNHLKSNFFILSNLDYLLTKISNHKQTSSLHIEKILLDNSICKDYRLIIIFPMPTHCTDLLSTQYYRQWFNLFDKALEILKKRPDAVIVTGCDWDEYNLLDFYGKNLIKIILDKVRQKNINLNRITWLHCNPMTDEWITNSLEPNEYKPQTLYHSSYLNRLNILNNIYKPSITKNNKKTHWFLSLNRIARLHRIYLSYWYSNYCKRPSYISCRIVNNNALDNKWKTKEGFSTLKKYFEFNDTLEQYYKFADKLPICIDFPSELSDDNQDHLKKEIPESSACYVVTETHFNFDRSDNYYKGWISEKTLKGFLYGLPCIWVGCSGIISSIKKIGFKSFSEIINEDYDEEPNGKKRMQMIITELDKLQEIENINEWYYQCFETYQHNYNTFKNLADRNIASMIENFYD